MANDTWYSDLLRRGGQRADGPVIDSDGVATRSLLAALDAAWEGGWQPADVVHLVRREAPASAAALVVALIAEHARRTDARSRAPETWVEQLSELDALAAGDPDVVHAWHRSDRRSPAQAWQVVEQLGQVLRTAFPIDVLVPPPSRWGSRRPPRAAAGGPGDDRVLRRIRGLLTKAESTEFPEEAEALTGKAQELMTRYSVDAALLAATLLDAGSSPTGEPGVGTHRLHVRDPYVRAKMQLLVAVADSNDVKVVWYSSLGIANLVGAQADLAAVELLFTSLLLQVAQALAAAERAERRPTASRSFRRSFLLGYAYRIGERLKTARQRATEQATTETGVDLLPVLRNRRAAVEARYTELFPRVRSQRSRASLDAGGWFAGRAAAERADVGRRQSSLR